MVLRETIIQLSGDITEDLCRNVITNICVRLQDVIHSLRPSGNYMNHLL
jgi:hypothetical protein